MNHQTTDGAASFPAAEEAGNSSDHAATATAVPEASESTWPEKSQGKIPLDVLLNPLREDTPQNDPKNRNENNPQEDRIDKPVIHDTGKGDEKAKCPAGRSSAQQSKVANNIVSNQGTICPDFQVSCPEPADLEAHGAAHIGPSKPRAADDDIICDTCFGVFKSARTLKVHIQIAHNGTPTAFCNRCAANFTSIRSLALHKRVHASERGAAGISKKTSRSTLHYCNYCNYSSYIKGRVQRHQRETHREGDPKKFRCMHGCGFVSELEMKHFEHEIFCPKATRK